MTYSSWDIECDTGIGNYGSFFALLFPPNNLENQNFEKMKTAFGYVILHMCTKNHNHIMYASWDVECNRHKFFEILGHSMPFGPPNNPKSQPFEKMRKTLGDIIILRLCITNDDHIMHGS